MKIGIDLDDVVFESMKEFLKLVKEIHDREKDFEEVYSYALDRVFELTPKDMEDLMKEVVWTNLDFVEGAKESILKLSEKNEIFFITSRTVKEGTKESLENSFSEIIYEIHFSSNPYAGTSGKDKGEIGKEIELDFMIEDSYEHAKICAEKGIKTFLIEKPWNKGSENHEKIVKVKDWDEILEALNDGI